MGLKIETDSDTVEKVKLSNYARRIEVYNKFVNTNTVQSGEIEWATEKATSISHKCNLPVIICRLKGEIEGNNPVSVREKLYTDKTENGKWISKNLTSKTYEYKQISMVISSDNATYKVPSYFNYVPIDVLNAA